MITNFHDKKMPKEKAPCKCLSIKMLDSVIKANKKYYPQTFRRMQICTRKGKNWELIHEYLEKTDSDSYSKDEIESDIDNDK